MEFVVLPDGGFALELLISWSAAGDNAVSFTLQVGDETRWNISQCPAGVFAAAVRFASEERFERSQGRRLPVGQIMQQAAFMQEHAPRLSATEG